jgi:undecaprenyl diphosphate synthase
MTTASETFRREIAERLPRHIAIVMDGNGRWAERFGRTRTFGHRMGARRIREITEECARLGVERLTLYAFSAENWKRPQSEVDFLMSLLDRYLVRERKTIMRNNVQFTAIGRLEELPEKVQRRIAALRRESSTNDGLTLCLALNYGGRAEIVDAAREAMRLAVRGELAPEALDEDRFNALLYAGPGVPDPDLLVRTGGDLRVSNFLLWEISYAEIYVTEVPWPEFRPVQLHRAIREFASRERRFGGLETGAVRNGDGR